MQRRWLNSKIYLVTIVLASLIMISNIMETSAQKELIQNGGFEEGLRGWIVTTYLTGQAQESNFHPYAGSLSLATWASGGPTPDQYGVVVAQSVGKIESLDLTYSFEIYPGPGVYAAVGAVSVRTVLRFIVEENGASKQLTVFYHVAWTGTEKNAQNRLPNQADYFVETTTEQWNPVSRNVRQDFEARFGPVSNYKPLSLEVSLELFAGVGLPQQIAYWDDVSLQAPETQTTTSELPATTETTVTSSLLQTTTTSPAAITTKQELIATAGLTSNYVLPIIGIVIALIAGFTLIKRKPGKRPPNPPKLVEPTTGRYALQDLTRRVQAILQKAKTSTASGALSQTRYNSIINRMKFKDANGRIWTVGAQTGRWYYKDRDKWKEATPAESLREDGFDLRSIELELGIMGESLRCPSCGAPNSPTDLFCLECGQKLH